VVLVKAKRKDFVNWGFLTLFVFAKNNSLKRGEWGVGMKSNNL